MAKQVKVKPGMAYTKSGVKKISGTATTSKAKTTKNPKLDDYISKGNKVPSKNKKGSVPPDYDVILPGMGYTKPTATKQPTKIKPKARPTAKPNKPIAKRPLPLPKSKAPARPSRINPKKGSR